MNILQTSWSGYCEAVQSERGEGNMGWRIQVLRVIREMFEEGTRFRDLDTSERQHVFGLRDVDGLRFTQFGGMRAAGRFLSAINANNMQLSDTLDCIPVHGDIGRQAYWDYVTCLRTAFPQGGDDLATASRLLAMKRPDAFVCVSSKNRDNLCEEFGVTFPVGDKMQRYAAYWDLLIEPIRQAPWWTSPPPSGGDELEVWKARAAFLDALYVKSSRRDRTPIVNSAPRNEVSLA